MNKVVQDYMLMESIGKGQYGNVYRAEHRKTKQIFAVKVMSVDKFKHTPKLSEFTNNQISILTKVNHPNIIRFVQMLRTNNNYYLVYEFCNGGTLADYIKSKGRLPQDEALHIFAQLRSAFQTLSKNQILHRDLKPTNILFHNGVIKIADFGFCKQMMNNELTQTMVGSPIYMAPEVLKGSVYDNRADIWSLGVILYEMLYGFCPYQESSICKLIGLIDNTILKFPNDAVVSNNTKTLLKKMMVVKYRSRMTAAELVAYPLQVKQISICQGMQPINSYSLKQILVLNRKFITYLAETLDFLAQRLQKDEKYASICYLVYKMFVAIQKQINRASAYWEILKVVNNNDQWDNLLINETQSMEPFGQIIKEILLSSGVSLPMKLELETHYIDFKYYIHLLSQFIGEAQARTRLVNCLLINRHYIFVMEKKTIDITDYTESKKSLQEKEEIGKRFAFTRT